MTRADSIERNTGFSVLAELVRAVFTAGLTIFLVRSLNPHGYGLYVIALSIGVLVLLPADFGISPSTSRFVAECRGDAEAAAAVVRDALRMKLVLATVLTAALVLLAGPIARAYDEPGLAWPMRIVAIAVFAQSLFTLYVAVFIGLARNGLQARLYLTEGVVETPAAVAAVLAGGGAAGALGGRAAGFGVAAAIGLITAVRLLGGRSLPGREVGDHARRIATYAGALFVIDAAYMLFEQIDILLVSAILGGEAAGLFQAPVRLITFIHLAGQAVSNAVAPRMTRSAETESDGDFEDRRATTLGGALRVLLILAAAATAVAVVWARPLVRIGFGSDYDRSADVLQALGPFIFLGVVGPLVTVSLNYLGAARRRLPVMLGTLGLQIVLDVLLIPPLGVVGPAVATDIAYGLYALFHFWLLHRRLHLDLRAIGLTLLRALLAAAALAGVLLLAGTGRELGAGAWVGGALGGGLAFAGLLVLTGELRTAELQAGRGALARMRDR